MSEPVPTIINAGVDTFMVNYKFSGEDDKPNGSSLPEHIIEQLDAWQVIARHEHDIVATDLLFKYTADGKQYQQSLLMRPHGSGIWSWLVYSDDIKLSLSYGTMNGGIFCQARFSAHLLWSIGPESALIALDAMLYDFIGSMVYQQASEIHLCVDLQDFDMSTLDWQHAFVTRVVRIRERPEPPTEEEQAGGLSPSDIRKLEASIQDGIHNTNDVETVAYPMVTTSHRKVATLDFGSHGSEISCQIYNKSAEIKVHEKYWFEPIYAANTKYDPTKPVTRVEFRVKRKFLASFHLNEAFSVLGQLELLWKYCTVEWLRYVDLSKSSDTNKSRVPTHASWEVIQTAYSSQDATITDIPPTQAALVKQSRTMAKRKAAIAGAIGYMRSAVALAGDEVGGVRPGASDEEKQAVIPDLLASLIWFFGQVQEYDTKKNRVHVEEILKKRLGYNFITAQELEHQRAHYGVSLSQSDWAELTRTLEDLRKKPNDVWLNTGGLSDIA